MCFKFLQLARLNIVSMNISVGSLYVEFFFEPFMYTLITCWKETFMKMFVKYLFIMRATRVYYM